MNQVTVLMTGAGAPGGPGILRQLQADKRITLFTCDASEHASGRWLSERFTQVPPVTDEAYLETLLDLCFVNKIQFVLPLLTRELPILSAAHEAFSDINCQVLVSGPEALNTVNHKGKLYASLQEQQIAVPAFREAASWKEMEAAVLSLGYPQEIICVKPCIANGSRGLRILKEGDGKDASFFLDKPGLSTCSMDNLKQQIGKMEIPEMVVSEYLPGEEYSVDCLCDQGDVKLVVPRLRSKISNGISVAGKFEKNQELIDYCTSILECFSLHGPIGIQVKRNAAGQFRIIEINPRIQGTSCAMMGAGINFPVACIENAWGKDVSVYADRINWHTAFVRYYEEGFYTY